jgi:hypothetical protein
MDSSLATLEQLLEATTPGPWLVELDREGQPSIVVGVRGSSRLAVRRDRDPAPLGEVEFIAISRQLLPRLTASLRSRVKLVPKDEVEKLEKSFEKLETGSWTAYLESRHAIGGDSMIRTSTTDERDLYLLLDGKIAPEADIEFVAVAHEVLVEVIRAYRRLEAQDQQSQ